MIDVEELLDADTLEDLLEDEEKMKSVDQHINKARALPDSLINTMSYPEDDPQARGTVTMKRYKEILESIDDKTLSKKGKEQKEAALKEIEQIGKVKIIDPRVLLRIFETYKYHQPALKDFI